MAILVGHRCLAFFPTKRCGKKFLAKIIAYNETSLRPVALLWEDGTVEHVVRARVATILDDDALTPSELSDEHKARVAPRSTSKPKPRKRKRPATPAKKKRHPRTPSPITTTASSSADPPSPSPTSVVADLPSTRAGRPMRAAKLLTGAIGYGEKTFYL